MAKSLFIAEKPSVAQEFAKALKMEMRSYNGYREGEGAVVTWCVGHLVTMSYPEAYDIKFKKWSLSTLPFIPQTYKYEVIKSAEKQYQVVASLLNRDDVDTIYVCTDSGREGEYIYRLVDQMAQVQGKQKKRVWIDSQTEDEIRRGIREAKDLSEYDGIAESAYLRAKEDYLMGINFSRLLTLKYGNAISNYLNQKYAVVSVGRVMTCVMGMVVRREREIREFDKVPFYRIIAKLNLQGRGVDAEWRVNPKSSYFESPKLYKENGFKKEEDAKKLLLMMKDKETFVEKVEKKKETKNPPLLYNLAELQNDCSKFFKISPDETLAVVQELYEKKMVTYPRTDARVLSTAVAKEIHKNIAGLKNIPGVQLFADEILQSGSYKGIAKTRYVNDKQITDHYAVIPTGQGLAAMKGLNQRAVWVYEAIVRRFLAIFYPAAIYQKVTLVTQTRIHIENAQQEEIEQKTLETEFLEQCYATFKILMEPGYLKVMEYSFQKKKTAEKADKANKMHLQAGTPVMNKKEEGEAPEEGEDICDIDLLEHISSLKRGNPVLVESMDIKEGETSPPKRYNSGSMILAMENAGQLIEDEELRAQIKGSGIGTSATRAEILKKLVNNKYLALNKKTQIITPTLIGEMIFDVVNNSIKSLLNPELTASWEKGLTYVAEGSITSEEYMEKLTRFVSQRTSGVMNLNNQYMLRGCFDQAAQYYKTASKATKSNKKE